MQDAESLDASRLLVLDLDAVDAGVRRATPAPTDHGADGGLVTFEDRLDPAVGSVADPPGHAERPGLLGAARPEEDPLHPARDDDMDAPHVDSMP